jgi:hypothetical protein
MICFRHLVKGERHLFSTCDRGYVFLTISTDPVSERFLFFHLFGISDDGQNPQTQ